MVRSSLVLYMSVRNNKFQFGKNDRFWNNLTFRSIPVKNHDQCKYLDWTNNHDKESSDSNYNFDQMPIGTPCGEESVCYSESNRQECRSLWVYIITRKIWNPKFKKKNSLVFFGIFFLVSSKLISNSSKFSRKKM